VIVRSSANVAAGGRGRLSTLIHGLLLFVAVVAAAALLNQIPLAALAAVLLMIGFNLAKPSLFIAQAKLGATQWVPFAAAIAGVLGLDLLKGVVIGIVVAIAMTVRGSPRRLVNTYADGAETTIRFTKNITFLSKLDVSRALAGVKSGAGVHVDATGVTVDHDVNELLAQFHAEAHGKNIRMRVTGVELPSSTSGH
jgi:MFS superfamily sulfate permease-like transporter